jgi:hypothetical protein
MKTKPFTQNRLIRPLVTIALIGGLSLAQVAQATTVTAIESDSSFNLWSIDGITDFSWDVVYAPGKGIIEIDNGLGTVNDVAADAVRITGDNSAAGRSLTRMTTDAPAGGGDVSFDWSYATALTDLPEFDPFVFIASLVAGDVGLVTVTTDGGAISQMGNAILSVADMAIWGFAIDSDDGLWGSASVTISNLRFAGAQTSVVPLPPAFLLFGSAIAGLGFIRKYKQAKV